MSRVPRIREVFFFFFMNKKWPTGLIEEWWLSGFFGFFLGVCFFQNVNLRCLFFGWDWPNRVTEFPQIHGVSLFSWGLRIFPCAAICFMRTRRSSPQGNLGFCLRDWLIRVGSAPPVIVTRIVTFLVGDTVFINLCHFATDPGLVSDIWLCYYPWWKKKTLLPCMTQM